MKDSFETLKMKIGQLIFHLPAEKKQKIKKIEKINKKIASVKSSLVFNRTYIHTYIYNFTNTICNENIKSLNPTFL